jgi:hypothetical protein
MLALGVVAVAAAGGGESAASSFGSVHPTSKVARNAAIVIFVLMFISPFRP